MLPKFRVREHLKLERNIILWAVRDSFVDPRAGKRYCTRVKDDWCRAPTDLLRIAVPPTGAAALEGFTEVCAPADRKPGKVLFAHRCLQVRLMQFSQNVFFQSLNRSW